MNRSCSAGWRNSMPRAFADFLSYFLSSALKMTAIATRKSFSIIKGGVLFLMSAVMFLYMSVHVSSVTEGRWATQRKASWKPQRFLFNTVWRWCCCIVEMLQQMWSFPKDDASWYKVLTWFITKTFIFIVSSWIHLSVWDLCSSWSHSQTL